MTATRLDAIQPSPTLAVSARAAELRSQGRKILNLSAGEPDFDTPPHIKAAAKSAIDQGDTHYTPADGTADLKAAIRSKLQRENNLTFTQDEVIVSAGAKQSLFNLSMALLNPGDEVLIPAPYWVSYPAIALLAEAKVIQVSSTAQNGFRMTPEMLNEAITPKSRLLILNSPGNPSGMAYSPAELEALGEILLKHPDLWIVSDDIYEHILWHEEAFRNILMAVPDLRERTVIVNGVSKAYAMTGWRIGYAAGPAQIIKAMKKLQSQSTSGPSSISQAAAKTALEGDQRCVRDMCDAFKARHDKFIPALDALPGIHCQRTHGAFYAFADCREAMAAKNLTNDVEFATQLLDEAEIAAIPGSAFGMPGFIRFSFATSQSVLTETIERLRNYLT